MLAEQINRFLKEKERRVLRRGRERGIGGGAYVAAGEVKTRGDQGGVIVIEFGASAKLGDHEVHRNQESNPKPLLPDQVCCAVPVPGWHGNNRPAGKVLRQIGWNILSRQKLQQGAYRALEFPIDIASGAIGYPIGMKRQGADEKQVDGGAGFRDVTG